MRYILVPEDMDMEKIKSLMISSDLVPGNQITTLGTKHTIESIEDTAKTIAPTTIAQVIPDVRDKEQKAVSESTFSNKSPIKRYSISPIILDCTVNKRCAIKLLTFLRKHKIAMNSCGEVLYNNNAIEKSNFTELFCDLVNGLRKEPPKKYEEFYKILNQCGIKGFMISSNRVKYFNSL